MAYKGLGYRYVRDPRADAFLMAPRLDAAEVEIPLEREHALGPPIDQGQEGSCVGHGWINWRNAAPVQPPNPFTHDDAVEAYNYAQTVDEWADTPPEEGTSVNAGAKAMMHLGALEEGYLWGLTVNDLLRWLGTIGPVVMVTLWLSKMKLGRGAFVNADGLIDGGHCYLAYGYGRTVVEGVTRVFTKFQNSWGGDWGDGGCFYMFVEEVQKLFNRGNYSMCSALELAPEPVVPTPIEPEPEPEIQRTKVLLPHLASRSNMYHGKHLDIYERRGGKETLRWRADPV